MAAVPINSPPEEPSEEESSDSEPLEDDSMEDEPSESETTNGETEANRTKDEFWVRYPSLKTFLGNTLGMVANGYVSDYIVNEKAKCIGDEKAKELNDRCNALCEIDMEQIVSKSALLVDILSSMKL